MRCCELSCALCDEFFSFIHFIFRSRSRLCRASLGARHSRSSTGRPALQICTILGRGLRYALRRKCRRCANGERATEAAQDRGTAIRMFSNRHAIAVIPARGGSKRIPRKNVKIFCGKPIIAWSIEAALASELFARVIVSTEDAEIAAVAVEWGAEVPFTRPAELADDFAGTTEVIAHAASWALRENPQLAEICCIYATAPLLRSEDLVRGLEALRSGKWLYAFSAAEFAAPIFRAMRRTPERGVEMLFPEHFATRSQDLPLTLHDAAQFYWGTVPAWSSKARIFAPHSVPVMIPRKRVQDIDTQEDWDAAEALFNVTKGG